MQAALRKAELESQLASIKTAQEAGRDKEYLDMLISNLGLGLDVLDERDQDRYDDDERVLQLERDTRILSERLETALLPLVQQEQEFIQSYGSGHPLLSSLRLRMNETRKLFGKLERQLKSSGKNQGDADDLDAVQLGVEYLEQELARIATSKTIQCDSLDTVVDWEDGSLDSVDEPVVLNFTLNNALLFAFWSK